MSAFTRIDLSRLPAPSVVDVPDYEAILAEMKAAASAAMPELAPVLELESEPALKVLQVCAVYVMLSRAEKNDAARSVMLAFATGSDLDHLGALFGVARAVLVPGDPAAAPPVPAIMEDDTRLRTRIQLALEGFSTAGPVGAYTYHALSASPLVRDVAITSPEPGAVLVTVLATIGDGSSDAALLATVESALGAESVRPLTDLVTVAPAQIVSYAVNAEIAVLDGPDPALVLAEAQAAATAHVEERRALGMGVARSGLFAALHRAGVASVTLTSPAADINCTALQSAHCTAITLTTGGGA
ncbi:MAG: baseplate J/gp47 family protein [Rhodobacteraceae bacterium]|nr:baseplate J/gp47 family protein [Paracoccaceae bacterium]